MYAYLYNIVFTAAAFLLVMRQTATALARDVADVVEARSKQSDLCCQEESVDI